MGFINERFLLFGIIGGSAIAALFCVIGVATKGWGGFSVFDFIDKAPGALAIISLLLLIACLALAICIVLKVGNIPQLPMILPILLFVSGIFLISCLGSVYNHSNNYSIHLIVVSLVLTYICSLLSVYWYASSQGSTA